MARYPAPLLALVTAVLAASPVLAAASDPATDEPCEVAGYNHDCNDLGHIAMVAAQEISGQPVRWTVHVILSTAFADEGAQWVMFTVRAAEGPESPLWITLDGLESAAGPIPVARVEQDGPHEVDAWVDVAAAPVGEPIMMNVTVGATQTGAFQLEALVMPFDHVYASMPTGGAEPANLFSFSTVGVNRATAGAPPTQADVPAPRAASAPALALGGVVLVAFAGLLRRRVA